jgi:hypothetical protein
MTISDQIVLGQDEVNLFEREKGAFANRCKLLLHYSYPYGDNVRHQYIYEDPSGKLKNFVFIVDKDKVTQLYKNSCGEIIDGLDTEVSTTMESVVTEIKVTP